LVQNARKSGEILHIELPEKLVSDMNYAGPNGNVKVFRFILSQAKPNMFWVQVGWKIYKVYEDPKDPMNMKFKKFANLKWMKEKFNVHANELMDFQMPSEQAGIGMVAFHPTGVLRLIVFKYEEEDK